MQRWTRRNPGCSKMKQLGQNSASEARNDKIRGKDQNERKKSASSRERPLPPPPPRLAIRHDK